MILSEILFKCHHISYIFQYTLIIYILQRDKLLGDNTHLSRYIITECVCDTEPFIEILYLALPFLKSSKTYQRCTTYSYTWILVPRASCNSLNQFNFGLDFDGSYSMKYPFVFIYILYAVA